jgi:hypothetical protein
MGQEEGMQAMGNGANDTVVTAGAVGRRQGRAQRDSRQPWRLPRKPARTEVAEPAPQPAPRTARAGGVRCSRLMPPLPAAPAVIASSTGFPGHGP